MRKWLVRLFAVLFVMTTLFTVSAENNIDTVIEVPESALVIKNRVYYGVDKDWFIDKNPEKTRLYLSISIPEEVIKIAHDGFRDNYTGDKKNNGAVTSNDKVGNYNIVKLDFSKAVDLEVIEYQASYNNEFLSGVLDLSNTKVKEIGKNAFGGCEGLTGVILPNELEILGDGTESGSVFSGCSNLQYIRISNSDQDTVFELPSSLKFIGKQTFKNCFAENIDNVALYIPQSVEKIGSEAFYEDIYSQIILANGDLSGYDVNAFKIDNAMLILKNSDVYKSSPNFAKASETFPVTIQFYIDNIMIEEQEKLYNQDIRYENKDGIWLLNENYQLPEIKDIETIPGYDSGWLADGSNKVLDDQGYLDGDINDILYIRAKNDAVVSFPKIDYYTSNGTIDPNTSTPTMHVEVLKDSETRIGLKVEHPLAGEEAKKAGTYVYFKYSWWDESEEGTNGPRSEEEPEIFSTSIDSINYVRKLIDDSTIVIRSVDDARYNGGDQYMVEVFGYYVENNGKPVLFYKSSHNFIGGSRDSNDPKCYTMKVEVTDANTYNLKSVAASAYQNDLAKDPEGLGIKSIYDDEEELINGYLYHVFGQTTDLYSEDDGIKAALPIYWILKEGTVYSNVPGATNTFIWWIKEKDFAKLGWTNTNNVPLTDELEIKNIDKVVTPKIEPASGNFNKKTIEVSISTETPDATIYYSIDGSEPDINSNIYSGPFEIELDATVKAVAVKDGMADSDIAIAEYKYKQEQSDEDNNEDDHTPSRPTYRPSDKDEDLPKTTAECQKEFGKNYIYSDEYGACVIKFMIVDTSTK